MLPLSNNNATIFSERVTRGHDRSIRFQVEGAYNDEDIMSEMQTLQVRPLSKERSDSQKPQMLNEINITPVDSRVK